MIDVDECSADSGQCDVNADCINSAGSYSCSCKQGFNGNGTTCEGMQECFLHDNVLQSFIHRLQVRFSLNVCFIYKQSILF